MVIKIKSMDLFPGKALYYHSLKDAHGREAVES